LIVFALETQSVVPTVEYKRVGKETNPGAMEYPDIVVRTTRAANRAFERSLYTDNVAAGGAFQRNPEGLVSNSDVFVVNILLFSLLRQRNMITIRLITHCIWLYIGGITPLQNP
jgi:hypothetical protein